MYVGLVLYAVSSIASATHPCNSRQLGSSLANRANLIEAMSAKLQVPSTTMSRIARPLDGETKAHAGHGCNNHVGKR